MQSFRRLTISSALRPLARSSTSSSRQFVRRLTQNSGQGGSYASTGRTHGNMGAKGSDVPWMIGSVAFTVPAAFYLLSSSPKPVHHSPDDQSHAKKATEKADAPKVAPEEEEESSSNETKDIKESVSNAREQTREAKDEAGEKASEVYGEAKEKVESSAKVTDTAAAAKDKASETIKGKSDEDTSEEEPKQDEPEDEPKDDGSRVRDAKKQVKKNLENRVEKTGGDGSDEPTDEVKHSERKGETKSQVLERLNRENSRKPSDVDPPSAGMKGPTSTNMQTGKQEGISNQDTFHPVLHSERGKAISKKSEGAHASAKLKGTVDPSRPAQYDATKQKEE